MASSRVTRADRLAQIRDLKSRGLNVREIALELGMKPAGVRNILTDPEGAKQRERRKRYQGSCAYLPSRKALRNCGLTWQDVWTELGLGNVPTGQGARKYRGLPTTGGYKGFPLRRETGADSDATAAENQSSAEEPAPEPPAETHPRLLDRLLTEASVARLHRIRVALTQELADLERQLAQVDGALDARRKAA